MTIDDLREWLAVLRANPDWKAEVRREVLSEELLSLPDLIRQNGEDIRELKDVVRQSLEDIRQNSVDIRELRESFGRTAPIFALFGKSFSKTPETSGG